MAANRITHSHEQVFYAHPYASPIEINYAWDQVAPGRTFLSSAQYERVAAKLHPLSQEGRTGRGPNSRQTPNV